MPQDNQNDNGPPESIGRVYSGEVSPPITTPRAIAASQALGAPYAEKAGAVAIHVYFVARGVSNPILQASMLAYTEVRVATNEDFDEIFSDHHGTQEAGVS